MKRKLFVVAGLTLAAALFIGGVAQSNKGTAKENHGSSETVQQARGLDEWEIHHGNQSAVITNLGADIRSYTVGNDNILVSYPKDTVPPIWNGVTLVPWPNRIAQGKYTWNGKTYQVPVNEIDKNCALHGYGWSSYWDLVKKSDDALTLAVNLPPTTFYPFSIHIESTYTLNDTGLKVHSEVKNIGKTTAPFGISWHPWYNLRGYNMDQVKLQMNAGTHVAVDSKTLIPTGEEPNNGTFDYSTARTLKNAVIDDAFVGLQYDRNNQFSANLLYPDGAKTKIWQDKSLPALQVCNAAWEPTPDKAAKFGVAIEAMSCYANAFNTGNLLTVLHPQQTQSYNWGIQFTK